jgi:uncharacterized protein (DUF433 family)
MEAQPTTTWKYLERRPKSSYKQLFVRGRRLSARTIYGQYVNEEEPQSIEDLAQNYKLPIEVIQEAIAYCEGNPPEILEDWESEERLASAMGMKDPNYNLHGKPKKLTAEELSRALRQ